MPACAWARCEASRRGCILCSYTLEPSGIKMPRTGEASTALAFSAKGMRPRRSCIPGASQDRNSRLVAQMSSRTCSKSFLLILLDLSNANSCSFSFRVLSGESSIVSRLKLIDHPHQTHRSPAAREALGRGLSCRCDVSGVHRQSQSVAVHARAVRGQNHAAAAAGANRPVLQRLRCPACYARCCRPD